MPTSFRLDILGGFHLRVAGQDVPPLPRKVRAMLSYLAVAQARPIPREQMGELLWSNRGGEQVRHSLRQAVAVLRKHLPGQDVVQNRDGALILADALQSDVGALLKGLTATTRVQLQTAADAYSGPLLEGFPSLGADFDDWLAVTRARLENNVLEILLRIADDATKAGDTQEALIATERMFAIDPLREDTHRRLLEACAAAGRRSDAMRHYATIVSVLRRDLGIQPARETRELAQQLREEMDPSPDNTVPTLAPMLTNYVGSGAPPIAVLPFRQIGTQSLPNHLTDGLTADIVCQLAGLRELSVISHGSTAGLKEPHLDARAVGRMLAVRYVVTGMIRRQGNVMRLTAELADAESGIVVWARSHETDVTLSFEDQDRVVAQIVNTLAPRVHEIELKRIRGKRPDSLTVYEKVLLAREYMLTTERQDYLAARRLLDDAVLAEPEYAEPYALLADWHSRVMNEGWSDNREADVSAVERMARKALDLDGDNVRALVFYGHRKSLLHRDYGSARTLFDRALEVSPGSAQAWLWSSYTFSYVGDTDEALRRAYRARDLSPRDRQAHDFYSALCVAHYTAGDYREAAGWGLRALGEPSILRATYRWAAASLAADGKLAEAHQIMRQGMDKMPNQRVNEVVRVSPYHDEAQRRSLGAHLLAAGFPP